MSERRVARFRVSFSFLAAAIDGRMPLAERIDNLPKKFSIIRVYQEFDDEWRGVCWLVIESDELPAVPEESVIPEITPIFHVVARTEKEQ